MPGLLTLPIRTLRRFFAEGCLQTAAGLSFATLLGLVPLLAVGAAVLTWFPLGDALAAALEKFLLANLLPEKAGDIVARYLGRFAQKAGKLTWEVAAGLAVTALIQMLAVESAINAIWKSGTPRPLLRRVARHLLAVLAGPLLFGGMLALTTLAASASFGLLGETAWARAHFFPALSFAFLAGLFAGLYRAVPNAAVPWRHAVTGGVLAALGLAMLQRLFSEYVIGFAAYRVVYGAFSALPIFLAWLHLSWSVVLLGALTVSELGTGAPEKRRSRR